MSFSFFSFPHTHRWYEGRLGPVADVKLMDKDAPRAKTRSPFVLLLLCPPLSSLFRSAHRFLVLCGFFVHLFVFGLSPSFLPLHSHYVGSLWARRRRRNRSRVWCRHSPLDGLRFFDSSPRRSFFTTAHPLPTILGSFDHYCMSSKLPCLVPVLLFCSLPYLRSRSLLSFVRSWDPHTPHRVPLFPAPFGLFPCVVRLSVLVCIA